MESLTSMGNCHILHNHLKKNRYIVILGLALAVLMFQGCAYSHVQGPLDTNFDNTVLGSKTGRADTHCVLWLFAWGDAGTRAAAKAGGITTITHADFEYTFYLFGVYSRVSTVVYGE
jgi:hypothetical protein